MWGRSITGRSASRPSLSTSIPTGAATTVTAISIAIVTATGIVATGIAIVTVVTGIVIGVIGTVIAIAIAIEIEIAATGAGIGMTGIGTGIARSVREIGIEIETAMTPPAGTRPRSVGEFAWAARTADRVTDRL